MDLLFVPVMTKGRDYDNNNLCIVNLINEPVLLGYTPTPFSWSGERQWFGSSRATTRVLLQFVFQLKKFLESFRILALQAFSVFYSLLVVFDSICHYPTRFIKSSRVSSSCNSNVGPFFASSIRAKNSSRVNSVGSACFSATSLRKYLAARFSRFSSSAMILILRSISAFNCIAVIILLFGMQK